MAYCDFTFEQLNKEFGIDVRGERFSFADAPELSPSPWLLESLQCANKTGFGSGKSHSERLISPVLVELSNCNRNNFAVISGANLDIDPAQGLNGECDFMLSFTRLQEFIRAPVFCIIATGYPDTDCGTVRCATQLLGAARFNERENSALATLYGCVTMGIEWRFLQLENQLPTLDTSCYFINEPAKLLGVLQHVVDQASGVKAKEARNSCCAPLLPLI